MLIRCLTEHKMLIISLAEHKMLIRILTEHKMLIRRLTEHRMLIISLTERKMLIKNGYFVVSPAQLWAQLGDIGVACIKHIVILTFRTLTF
jgi:hypothetical protein